MIRKDCDGLSFEGKAFTLARCFASRSIVSLRIPDLDNSRAARHPDCSMKSSLVVSTIVPTPVASTYRPRGD